MGFARDANSERTGQEKGINALPVLNIAVAAGKI
jgi:hypothetical protein